MLSHTETIQQEYQQLQTLKNIFLLEHGKTIKDEANPTDQELTIAKRSVVYLTRQLDFLDKKLWPFAELPQQQLNEQYQSQKETFQSIGLLTELSPSTFGLSSRETIDGQSYPFPSYEKIRETMIKNKERLTTKINQGFTRLLIVPIALKLSVFQDKTSSFIKTKHGQGRLLGSREPRGSEFKLLNLNKDTSFVIWSDILQGEETGKLIYYPQDFHTDPDKCLGLTKPQLIKQLTHTPFPGHEALLIENNLYLPKEGEGVAKGQGKDKRLPLTNNNTPKQHLSTITATDPTSPYRYEIGLTIETFIADFLLHLAATDHIKYDYCDHDIAYLIGNSFSGDVLYGCFSRDDWNLDGRMLYISMVDPDNCKDNRGCPPAVRVFPLNDPLNL